MLRRHHTASWQSQEGTGCGVRRELTSTPVLAVYKQFHFSLSLSFLFHETEAIVIEDIFEDVMR